jgi:hypothetical protein
MNESFQASPTERAIMGNRKSVFRSILPMVFGAVAVTCALLGLIACCGYGSFAARGIHLTANSDPVVAHRMASLAGYFTVAQLLLSLHAISLGGIAMAIGKESRSAGQLGRFALAIGGLDFLLLFMLV